MVPDFPLFVPADRPDRIAKALAAGADGAIVDLEDAVAPARKDAARDGLAGALPAGRDVALLLRVNAVGTRWHDADVAAARGFDGVVLPKAEDAAAIDALRGALRGGAVVVALIETVAGLEAVDALARAADRIAFGSIDFALDLGCAHTRMALLPIRSRLVRAARLAGRPAPLDGVTAAVDDADAVSDDAAHGAEMGFGGKLLIHPRQIGPARAAFRPRPAEIAWAERVAGAAAEDGAVMVDGAMVDAPVVARARRILSRAEGTA